MTISSIGYYGKEQIMTRKKFLLPILAALPLLFMANSPAPISPVDDYYRDIETVFVDKTGEEEDAPYQYEVNVKNTGNSYATVFGYYGNHFYLQPKSCQDEEGSWNRCYPKDIECKRFETSLFFNEIILPSETRTYTIYPSYKLDPLPEKEDFYSRGINESTFIETCDTLTISAVEGVDNQYAIYGYGKKYDSTRLTMVIELTYDGNNYAFFVERDNKFKYTIDTFEELDLTKLTITKASLYKSYQRSSGSGGAYILLFLLMIIAYGSYGGLILVAIGVFIVAPAIVIPLSIKRGKRRAEEREKREKRAEKQNNEFGIDDSEVHPEDFDDINKIE